ncbi:serine protease [Paraflavitalea sp. CAU 1676]|uniref:S1C family serine protease n=1 Tax=Paraflavitalea sp. CAU 1676 TaxID=3032598 RepID=UPI0023D980A4|nr:serine protease [Paraflavitalea sp. CAU 1676]MDF2188319.1 serine protease [Paraflavitalea sp. CAU 1676]
MKHLITPLVTCILFVVSFSAFAQSDVSVLNGYKYIYLRPLTYQDGTSDKWGIRNAVREKLMASGLTVLEAVTLTPQGTPANCLTAVCTIDHTNNAYQAASDYIYLKIFNCQGQTIYASQGATGAVVLSFQQGWRKATKEALRDFSSYKYKFDEKSTFESKLFGSLPPVEKIDENEETLKKYFSETAIDPIEGIYKSYQAQGMTYYKVAIKKFGTTYKMIIIDAEYRAWRPGEVKAYFEQSSMTGLFSVKWYMGDKRPYETFGSFGDDAILTIELKDNQTGQKRQDKFIKMFPLTSNGRNVNTGTKIKASGSGFFISTDGLVATNAHVVEGSQNITLSISHETGNSKYKAKILLIDNKNDVAILKIEDENFTSLAKLPFGIIEDAEIGEKVFTIGYPLNDIMGSNYKVNDGIVSSKSGIADDIRYYQISVPLQPGNSGGPLFNKQGNIIGITSARLNSKAVGTEVENVNYAIKSAYLLNLYNMLPSRSKINTSSQVANKELKDQIKVLKDFVCLIVVN